MNDPLVSVCCITYNHANYVREAIQSLINQTYRSIEIIVIDDGSTDDTLSQLQIMKESSPFPMSVRTQPNTGRVGKNINLSLSFAKGKYVRFLSLDDAFTPDSTTELVKMMEEDPSRQFIGCDRADVIDKLGALTQTTTDSPFIGKTATELTVDDFLRMEHVHGGTFFIQNAIFRKDILDRSGGCDEDLLGDDITLRIKLFRQMIADNLLGFGILNHSAFLYRIHDTNLHKNARRQVATLQQVCDKYFDGVPSPILKEWVAHAIRANLDAIRDLMNSHSIHRNSPALRCEIADSINGFQNMIYRQYLGVPIPFVLYFGDAMRRLASRVLRSMGLSAIAYRFFSIEASWYQRLIAKHRKQSSQENSID